MGVLRPPWGVLVRGAGPGMGGGGGCMGGGGSGLLRGGLAAERERWCRLVAGCPAVLFPAVRTR